MFEKPDILDSTVCPSAVAVACESLAAMATMDEQSESSTSALSPPSDPNCEENNNTTMTNTACDNNSKNSPGSKTSSSIIAELKTEHLKSLKRKPFTASMNTLQKRLRKKAKLQKILNLNKNKYNSLSSSSSFSSLSSSSSAFSQISAKSMNQKPKKQQDPPVKLHKFYHSVPFKCPFCFTFKESPTEFIDHMAETHYPDVKLLYEKKCTVVIENMNRKEAETMETKKTEVNNNNIIKSEANSIQSEISSEPPKSQSLYTSSSLPPRKQQRLLKSPLLNDDTIQKALIPEANGTNWMNKTVANNKASEDYFNFYYNNNNNNNNNGKPYQQADFAMPSIENAKNAHGQTQNFNQSKQSLIMAAAAAASMFNQSPKANNTTTASGNNNNNSYLPGSKYGGSAQPEASMKCAICDRGFEYYSNLRRHIKTKHKIFGKQVKEYVIRHQLTNNNNNNSNLMQKTTTKETSSSSQANESNNSSQSKFNSEMMSPTQSASASNQNTSNNGNYMDLGLTNVAKSNPSSNGKNSPLSSMSSSSMCSIKSLSKNTGNNRSTVSGSSHKANTDDTGFEDDIDQIEMGGSSSASSTASFQGFKAANGGSSMAAVVAAISGCANNDMSSLMMSQMLNSQANAMTKMKSSFLESLLQRKLPNKYSSMPTQNQPDMASMAAAVMAASLGQNNVSSDELISQNKSNNLNKLLQNIVEMNQMSAHFGQGMPSSGMHVTASLASSSPSSSSVSSSPLDHHCEKQQSMFNSSFKSDLCNNNIRQEENNTNTVDRDEDLEENCDMNEEEKLVNDDCDQFNEDSINGFQDHENQEQYDNEEQCGDLDDENLGQMQNNPNEMDDDIDETDMRSRSPSNSSKSSGCSSMSSLIQKQFLSQQKQQLPAAETNKLLMSHLAGLAGQSAAGMNTLAFENHLKNFQQQRHLMQQQQQVKPVSQPFQQPHGNYNSYNANGMKRKKSQVAAAYKEFSLNSFIPSAPAMMGPSNFDQQNNRMASTTPPSPGGNVKLENNQIRYSSEIWRCPYCCYETTSASRYNSHLVCHGWKPYLCPHCGSRSNRLPDMRTHISTFHPEFNVNTFVVLGEEEAKATLKDYMKNRALINRKLKEMRPQPKFKCKLCPYASLYQFNLTKHVKSVHLNEIYNQNNTNNASRNNQNISNDS